jgi:hypothetical protein
MSEREPSVFAKSKSVLLRTLSTLLKERIK